MKNQIINKIDIKNYWDKCDISINLNKDINIIISPVNSNYHLLLYIIEEFVYDHKSDIIDKYADSIEILFNKHFNTNNICHIGTMYGDGKSNVGQKRTPCTKSKEEIQVIITKSKSAQGLSKFIYGDKVIWALNQKTANKKAIKKGYLL